MTVKELIAKLNDLEEHHKEMPIYLLRTSVDGWCLLMDSDVRFFDKDTRRGIGHAFMAIEA